jgi:UPF0176 protein
MNTLTTIETYQVLLYYKYVHIKNYEALAKEHLAFCKELNLRGRVLIAYEGINGTVSGTKEETEKYMEYMHEHPLFHDMPFKIDEHDGHAFKRLSVRPRKEIVTWRLDEEVDPSQVTGAHLSPKEFNEHLKRDDVIVIDGRNEFEYDLGHFRGAIRPKVNTTREFPEWVRENLSKHKDKKIITYCTGGIRCEKLTSFLISEGFEDVAQLDGGIVTYGKDPEVKGELFDGKCYVFDERISVPINQVEPMVIGKCYHCNQPAETYINCANDFCHRQHIVCPTCQEKHHHFCSEKCEDLVTQKQAEDLVETSI